MNMRFLKNIIIIIIIIMTDKFKKKTKTKQKRKSQEVNKELWLLEPQLPL